MFCKTLEKNKIVVGLLITSIPLIYLAVVYPALPEYVSMNYNLSGELENEAPKSTVLILIAGLTLLTLIIFLLFKFIHLLIPRISPAANSNRMQNIGLLVAGFMAFVQCWLLHHLRTWLRCELVKNYFNSNGTVVCSHR